MMSNAEITMLAARKVVNCRWCSASARQVLDSKPPHLSQVFSENKRARGG